MKVIGGAQAGLERVDHLIQLLLHGAPNADLGNERLGLADHFQAHIGHAGLERLQLDAPVERAPDFPVADLLEAKVPARLGAKDQMQLSLLTQGAVARESLSRAVGTRLDSRVRKQTLQRGIVREDLDDLFATALDGKFSLEFHAVSRR